MNDSPAAPRRHGRLASAPVPVPVPVPVSAPDKESLEMRRLRQSWNELWNETGEKMPLDNSLGTMKAFMDSYVTRRLDAARSERNAEFLTGVKPHVMAFLNSLENVGLGVLQGVANQLYPPAGVVIGALSGMLNVVVRYYDQPQEVTDLVATAAKVMKCLESKVQNRLDNHQPFTGSPYMDARVLTEWVNVFRSVWGDIQNVEMANKNTRVLIAATGVVLNRNIISDSTRRLELLMKEITSEAIHDNWIKINYITNTQKRIVDILSTLPAQMREKDDLLALLQFRDFEVSSGNRPTESALGIPPEWTGSRSSWVSKYAAFRNLLSTNNLNPHSHKVLLLEGAAGIGKTVALKTMAAEITTNKVDKWLLLKYFHTPIGDSDDGSGSTSSSGSEDFCRRVVRSLLWQYASSDSEMAQSFIQAAKILRDQKRCPFGSNQWRTWWRQLFLENDREKRGCVVIVDCDESVPASYLQDLLKLSLDTTTGKKALRFIVAGPKPDRRNEINLVSEWDPDFKRAYHVKSVNVCKHSGDDITAFIAQRLSPSSRGYMPSEDIRNKILTQLPKISKQNFNQITAFFKYIESARTAEEVEKRLTSFQESDARKTFREAWRKHCLTLPPTCGSELTLMYAWLFKGFIPLKPATLNLLSHVVVLDAKTMWFERADVRIKRDYHLVLAIDSAGFIGWATPEVRHMLPDVDSKEEDDDKLEGESRPVLVQPMLEPPPPAQDPNAEILSSAASVITASTAETETTTSSVDLPTTATSLHSVQVKDTAPRPPKKLSIVKQDRDLARRILKAMCPDEIEFKEYGFQLFIDQHDREVIARDRHNEHLQMVVACLKVLVLMPLIYAKDAQTHYFGANEKAIVVTYAVAALGAHMESTVLEECSNTSLKAEAGRLLGLLFTRPDVIDLAFGSNSEYTSAEHWFESHHQALGRMRQLFVTGKGIALIQNWLRDEHVSAGMAEEAEAQKKLADDAATQKPDAKLRRRALNGLINMQNKLMMVDKKLGGAFRPMENPEQQVEEPQPENLSTIFEDNDGNSFDEEDDDDDDDEFVDAESSIAPEGNRPQAAIEAVKRHTRHTFETIGRLRHAPDAVAGLGQLVKKRVKVLGLNRGNQNDDSLAMGNDAEPEPETVLADAGPVAGDLIDDISLSDWYKTMASQEDEDSAFLYVSMLSSVARRICQRMFEQHNGYVRDAISNTIFLSQYMLVTEQVFYQESQPSVYWEQLRAKVKAFENTTSFEYQHFKKLETWSMDQLKLDIDLINGPPKRSPLLIPDPDETALMEKESRFLYGSVCILLIFCRSFRGDTAAEDEPVFGEEDIGQPRPSFSSHRETGSLVDRPGTSSLRGRPRTATSEQNDVFEDALEDIQPEPVEEAEPENIDEKLQSAKKLMAAIEKRANYAAARYKKAYWTLPYLTDDQRKKDMEDLILSMSTSEIAAEANVFARVVVQYIANMAAESATATTTGLSDRKLDPLVKLSRKALSASCGISVVQSLLLPTVSGPVAAHIRNQVLLFLANNESAWETHVRDILRGVLAAPEMRPVLVSAALHRDTAPAVHAIFQRVRHAVFDNDRTASPEDKFEIVIAYADVIGVCSNDAHTLAFTQGLFSEVKNIVPGRHLLPSSLASMKKRYMPVLYALQAQVTLNQVRMHKADADMLQGIFLRAQHEGYLSAPLLATLLAYHGPGQPNEMLSPAINQLLKQTVSALNDAQRNPRAGIAALRDAATLLAVLETNDELKYAYNAWECLAQPAAQRAQVAALQDAQDSSVRRAAKWARSRALMQFFRGADADASAGMHLGRVHFRFPDVIPPGRERGPDGAEMRFKDMVHYDEDQNLVQAGARDGGVEDDDDDEDAVAWVCGFCAGALLNQKVFACTHCAGRTLICVQCKAAIDEHNNTGEAGGTSYQAAFLTTACASANTWLTLERAEASTDVEKLRGEIVARIGTHWNTQLSGGSGVAGQKARTGAGGGLPPPAYADIHGVQGESAFYHGMHMQPGTGLQDMEYLARHQQMMERLRKQEEEYEKKMREKYENRGSHALVKRARQRLRYWMRKLF